MCPIFAHIRLTIICCESSNTVHIPLLMHPFIREILTEHLLCIWCCSGQWDSAAKRRSQFCTHRVHSSEKASYLPAQGDKTPLEARRAAKKIVRRSDEKENVGLLQNRGVGVGSGPSQARGRDLGQEQGWCADWTPGGHGEGGTWGGGGSLLGGPRGTLLALILISF